MTSCIAPLTSTQVRQRIPWFSLGGILFVVFLTLGNAAVNLMPSHIPTARELQRAEQNQLIRARRERIGALLAEGDHCRPPIARELARALVFDGRSAIAYADDYASRCGDDPIVRRWADASAKLALPSTALAAAHYQR
jgi:hypothetical protein